MYDTEGRGHISKEQIGKMFRSLVEMAQTDIAADSVDQLVDSLCTQAGLTPRETYRSDPPENCHLTVKQLSKT